ncbi:MAG: S-layer homology domain-containing protein, partial [Promicromonosporaceae bacterium]|nr:S-layer homology domain-containing protein [Promicromonosporaceae bacterium]
MAAFLYRELGSPAYTPPAHPSFSDVPKTSAFYLEIEWLASTGITTGWPDGTFRPGNNVTREAMAAFLYRAVGVTDFTAPETSPFSDVAAESNFYQQIAWLANSGVTTGWADGTFRPGNNVTREAMAAFLFRADDLIPKVFAATYVPGVSGHSALVRLTVANPAQNVSVWAAGAPLLQVSRGATQSATVLVPVLSGTIPVYASAAVSGTVEVLATFNGNSATPGAVTALPAAQNRADSDAAWAPTLAVGSTEQAIGLVGRGGIPSSGVRAVFVTALVESPVNGQLHIGGQTISVTPGVTPISTVVVPDAMGGVNVSFSGSGTVNLRLDARGWAANSVQGMTLANTTGSFVPVVSGTVPTDFAQTLDLRGGQIVLLAPGSVAQNPVGGFLALATPPTAAPAVSFSYPANGATIDLEATGGLVMSGFITGSASVDSVALSAGYVQIGYPEVKYTENGVEWAYKAQPPAGYHTVTVTVWDRSGMATTSQVTLFVPPLRDDSVVVQPNARVVANNSITAVTGSTMTLGSKPAFVPGDVVVTTAGGAVPEAFIRRVEAIDRIGAEWVVYTSPAALTDVFQQAHVDATFDLFGNTTTSPAISEAADHLAASAIPDCAVINDDYSVLEMYAELGIHCELNVPFDLSVWTPDAIRWHNGYHSGTTMTGRAKLGIGIRLAFDIDSKWSWTDLAALEAEPTLTRFEYRISIKRNLDFNLTTSVGFKVEIAKWEFGTKRFVRMVGPIPIEVAIKPKATIEANTRIEANSQVGLGIHSEGVNTVGLRYTNLPGIGPRYQEIDETRGAVNTWSPITEPPGSAVLRFEGGPAFTGQLMFYEIAGPALKFSAFPGARVIYGYDDAEPEPARTESRQIQVEAFMKEAAQLKFQTVDLSKTQSTFRNWKIDYDFVKGELEQNLFNLCWRYAPPNEGWRDGKCEWPMGEPDDGPTTKMPFDTAVSFTLGNPSRGMWFAEVGRCEGYGASDKVTCSAGGGSWVITSPAHCVGGIGSNAVECESATPMTITVQPNGRFTGTGGVSGRFNVIEGV